MNARYIHLALSSSYQLEFVFFSMKGKVWESDWKNSATFFQKGESTRIWLAGQCHFFSKKGKVRESDWKNSATPGYHEQK